MKIDGHCHCGYISYEAEADPDNAGICHCTDCQTLSGTAFRTVLRITDGSFRMLSGEPTVYVKIAESGAQREQAFLPALRLTDLCNGCRRGAENLFDPARHRAPARPAHSKGANLDALT